MKNKGFTLIELLAVIVILAIIAIIATPIILNIINDAKDSAKVRSAELYIDLVNKVLASKNLTTPIVNAECEIQNDGNLLCDDIEINVDIDGEKPNFGTITIENGAITDAMLVIGDAGYGYDNNNNLVEAYTVTFDSNGGTEIPKQYVVAGNKAKKPRMPYKQGYKVTEWQLNNTTYDFDTPITNNITLTAVWGETSLYTTKEGKDFNKTLKSLSRGSTVSSYGIYDEIVEHIDFYPNGELPEGYTLQALQALPSKDVSYNGQGTIKAYYDDAAKSIFIYSDGEIVFNSINTYMFFAFRKLKNFVIPQNATSVGWGFLSNCINLSSVTIPYGTEVIGTEEFYGCKSLKSIKIPNSVTTIATRALSGTGLTSLEIPASVTRILPEAITYNYDLTSVTIPNSITVIEKSAFRGCSSLKSIILPNNLTSIDQYAFAGTGLTSITIPNSVTSIGYAAFYGCISLENITLSDSMTAIAGYTFDGCKKLKSIVIPSNITIINTGAFEFSGLQSITLNEGLISIGNSAFNNCTDLNSITIPSSVTSIGQSAFEKCTSLISVTILDGVTSIGKSAFSNCSSLTSVTIPSSVTSIGNSAFYGCNSLEAITVDSNNTVYEDRNSNAIIEIETNELVAGCKNTTIPSSVTSIGENAFAGCTSLTSITIPSSVTNIAKRAFYGNKGLTSITIPLSVTTIGQYAFDSCSNLTSATFEEPTGWKYYDTPTSTSGSNLNLSNVSTNATYLRSTYYNKYWKRS